MRYFTTRLEDTVERLYRRLGIIVPNYDIASVADQLDIILSFHKLPLPFATTKSISLDPHLSKEKQKEIFAHELGHVLHDSGIQVNMPDLFRMYQEYKARNFALQFCIPTFMLRRLELSNQRSWNIYLIADTFGVTRKFAETRLDHYESQIVGFTYYDSALKFTDL